MVSVIRLKFDKFYCEAFGYFFWQLAGSNRLRFYTLKLPKLILYTNIIYILTKVNFLRKDGINYFN